MWKSSACSKYNATVETTAGFASNSTTNVCLMLAFILKMLELFFSLTLNKFFMNLFWSKIYKYPKINLRQFFCQRWWLQDSNFQWKWATYNFGKVNFLKLLTKENLAKCFHSISKNDVQFLPIELWSKKLRGKWIFRPSKLRRKK